MSLDDITPPTIIPRDDPSGIRVHIQFLESKKLEQWPFDVSVAANRLCNNQALRLPSDLTEWPRAVIFDFVYGAAALKRWYERGTMVDWEDRIQEIYNEPAPYEEEEDHSDSDDMAGDGNDDETAKLPLQEARHGRPSENSASFAMDFVYALWQRNAQRNTVPDFTRIKSWLGTVTGYESD